MRRETKRTKQLHKGSVYRLEMRTASKYCRHIHTREECNSDLLSAFAIALSAFLIHVCELEKCMKALSMKTKKAPEPSRQLYQQSANTHTAQALQRKGDALVHLFHASFPLFSLLLSTGPFSISSGMVEHTRRCCAFAHQTSPASLSVFLPVSAFVFA